MKFEYNGQKYKLQTNGERIEYISLPNGGGYLIEDEKGLHQVKLFMAPLKCHNAILVKGENE